MVFFSKTIAIQKLFFVIICVLLIFSSKPLISQDSTSVKASQKLNAISGGLFGDGSFISAGYQRFIPISDRLSFSLKLGVGFTFYSTGWLSSSNNVAFTPVYVIPSQLLFTIGRKNILELGINGSYFSDGYPIRRYFGWETTSAYKLFPLVGFRKVWKNENGSQEYFGLYVLLSNFKKFENYYFLFVPVGLHGGIYF